MRDNQMTLSSSEAILSLYQDGSRFQQEETELIGRGGFGRVFRVFNKLDDRYYAIKKILVTESNIKGALHEIRILASVIHPRIIRYFHSWIESRPVSSSAEDLVDTNADDDDDDDEQIVTMQGRCYFVNIQMEYCEGSLRQYLWSRCAVDVPACYHIMSQIVEGLEFLHRSGIVHRDMKPDNILLYTRNPIRIKISDFGLAKVFHKQLSTTECTTYLGSYLYASPEQYAGRGCSYPTDIYSLGILLLEIQKIFRTEMERICCLTAFREQGTLPLDVHYKDLLLEMTHADPAFRATLPRLRGIFEQPNDLPILWCRDVVWDVILKVMQQINK